MTRSPTRQLARSLALAVGVAALAASGAAQAQSHGGWHGGGGYHGGWHGGGYYRGGGWGFWPWVGLGVGLGLATDPLYYGGPNYVVVDRPAPYYYGPPQPAAPMAAPAADPIFYPRNGQTAAQVETDRQACNRWATSYPRAMEDASVFQRATLACMDGHGYTSR